jgi:hypothetical protein
MADPFVQSIVDAIANKIALARAVIPGRVQAQKRAANGEQDVKFLPGIGRRIAGEAVADGPVDPAPVLFPAGGGFSIVWPIVADDEALGLAADRNSEWWRAQREVGQASSRPRSHDLSDALILPVAITPPNAPDDPGEDLVISGPEGEAIRVAGSGSITITQGGLQVATISMESGDVTIDVAGSQSVFIGDSMAVALAKAQAMIGALDGAIDAAIVAAAPILPPNGGDGGTAAFTAFQGAWDGAKNNIPTTKAKGT